MPDEDVDFRIIRLDEDAIEIKDYAVKKNRAANIFVEHDVDEASQLVDIPNCVISSQVGESSNCVKGNELVESSEANRYIEKGKAVMVCPDEDNVDEGGSGSSDEDEDEAYDHFDDSEDDRALCLEDGFEPYDKNPLGFEYSDDYMDGVVDNSYKPSNDKPDKPRKPKKKAKVVEQEQHADPEWEKDYLSEELLSDDLDDFDYEGLPRYPEFKMGELTKDYKFKVGMDFKSIAEFKEAISEWSVLNLRQIKFVKQDKERCRAVCKDIKCNYVVHYSKVADSHTFKIKTLSGNQTCAKSIKKKIATSKWVTKEVLPKIMTTGDMPVKDIMKDLRRKHSVGVSFHVAWKAKKMAKEIIEGDCYTLDAKKQYTLLWRYAAELHRVSLENTLKINVERTLLTNQPRFNKFYFCFEGCKKGFLSGCRPFIGVDGCHLKTMYGGILLVTVGRDANDQYYPLAFGVVENETNDAWRWFLTLLLNDIGTDRRWVFISDQQKGLIPVLEKWSDRLEHRLCLRHLYANFKKKFGGGSLIRDLMMGAAKATYFQAWDAKMNELKKVDHAAWEWLRGHNPKLWCKHAFSYYPKCDVLMNNISESFNATILLARDKPILITAEWIRTYIMNRISSLREKLSKWEQNIMPMPKKRLNTEIQKAGNWIATWGNGEEFEVEMFGGG
ncbi:uncharacterized protein [Medicago truncatula]|uniref:uncharacterized protein n=1 Tax=Medicago truncatula TaxID=3880 RepID=UPI001966CF0D|nr:uncharacterized protein LOC120576999 [Medicago truncatula]